MSVVFCVRCGERVDSDVIEIQEWLDNGEVICEKHDIEEDDEFDGQPDEMQEWADFDPDC